MNNSTYNHKQLVLSGLEFKKRYGNKFYVIMNDPKEFSIVGHQNVGFINFIDEKMIIYWVGSGSFVSRVSIFSDSRVYVDRNKYMTNKLLLHRPQHIVDFLETWKSPNNISRSFIQKRIQHCYDNLILPNNKKTPDVCLNAVTHNGLLLGQIPRDVISIEICLSAVKQNYLAWSYIPPEMRIYRIWLEVVSQSGQIFDEIPKSMRTPELYLACVKKNGLSLAKIPLKSRTFDICMSAVENCAEAIIFVPEKIRNEDIYLTALERNALILNNIPLEKRTRDMWITVIDNLDDLLDMITKQNNNLTRLRRKGRDVRKLQVFGIGLIESAIMHYELLQQISPHLRLSDFYINTVKKYKQLLSTTHFITNSYINLTMLVDYLMGLDK